MVSWQHKEDPSRAAAAAAARLRRKYATFRRLLSLNNECLELMGSLQEDLQFISPRREVVGERVAVIFQKVQGIVDELSTLEGKEEPALTRVLNEQRQAV